MVGSFPAFPFLMHLVATAEAAKRAIDEVLQPELLKSKIKRKGTRKKLIGTVAGYT